MISDQDVDNFLEHYGVKGMKWGIRKDRRSSGSGSRSGSTSLRAKKKVARADMKSISRSAREIIKESRNAKTSAQRKRAADRYEKEVVDVMRSKQFKDAYRTATQVGKGEIAAHIILYGAFSPITIKSQKEQSRSGARKELSVARDILEEMRSG